MKNNKDIMATTEKPNIISFDLLKELIEKLPPELVSMVLSKLQPKFLGQLKTLSPSLRDMVTQQFVVHKSNHKIPLQLEIYDGSRRLFICNVDEHGSAVTRRVVTFQCKLLELHHCNGLIGFFSEERRLNLCNLTTLERVELATLERVELQSVHQETDNQHFCIGFEPITKLHKVIVWHEIENSSLTSYPSNGMVLTLEEGTSWRPVPNLPQVQFLWKQPHVAVSGTIFWLVDGERFLRSFNLKDETFGIVELPRGSLIQINEELFRFSLTEFEGCLCWVVQASRASLVCNPVEILEMWILKDMQQNDWVDMTPHPNLEVPMEGTHLKAYYDGELGPIVYPSITVHNGAVLIGAADDRSQYLFWYSPLNGQYMRMLLSGIDVLSICLKKHVGNSLSFSKLLSSNLLYHN